MMALILIVPLFALNRAESGVEKEDHKNTVTGDFSSE